MYVEHLLPKLLAVSTGILLVYMSLWFVIARRRGRLDTVDIAWGGGFVLVAWLVAVWQPTIRSYMVAVMVSVWAIRLTGHLAERGLRRAEDPRYLEVAKNWRRVWLRAYFSIYVFQGLLILLIGLPIITNAGMALPELRWLFTLGYTVWAVGFYIEYKADDQLRRFKADKKNKGQILDTGLWQYSRHPNYFGELLQWWGIGLVAAQTSFGWAGLAGPLVLTYLIYYVSGIPPIEKRYANNKKYQAYKRRTNPLLPWPTKNLG
jgi:steroid 5-alpha reductase family enzyme